MITVKIIFFVLLTMFLPIFPAQAVCPLCTVAVGAGVGLSRWLGIDDTITGIWIGGLIISSGLWLAKFIKKKNWKVPYRKTVSVVFFYLIVVLPMKWGGMIGAPGNNLIGIDRLILGIGVGSLVFIASLLLDNFLRKTNNQEVLFYYQKVILPLFFLSVTSFIFYLVIN